MKSLSTIAKETPYYPNKHKLKNILKYAAQIKLNSCDLNTKSHLLCNVARDTIFEESIKNKLVILQVPVSFNEIIPNNSLERIDKDKLANLGCGRYSYCSKEEKYTYNYEYLSQNIQDYVEERKIIYIMFIFKEYGIDEYLDKKGKTRLEYSTHSTSMIMIPNKNNNEEYKSYYINSHGRDMEDTNIFKRISSSRRTLNKKFEKPVELLFIGSLINYWNSLTTMKYEKNINIYWDETKVHTYLDSDLQSGDGHGVCFIFPQVILHKLGEFYNKSQSFTTEWGTIHVNSVSDLINSGRLAIFVKSSFIEFSKHYRKTFLNTLLSGKVFNRHKQDILEKTIMKENTRFIKSILFNFIYYMKQIHFKNK